MRACILLLLAAALLLAGCPTDTGDDDSATIEPITPAPEDVTDFVTEGGLFCSASGWSTTADATVTQYELYSCFGPSNLTDAVYDVSSGSTPTWQSDGSTDGRFVAYTNPMYGLVGTATTVSIGSN